jgi:hypothetical protein
MARRFCGDVKIDVKFQWTMNQYRAYVQSPRGTRNVRLTIAAVMKDHADPNPLELDSPTAYDRAARVALEKAMDATSAADEQQAYVAKEIADAAALGLSAGGYQVLRAKDYSVWLDQQTAPFLQANG